MQTPKGFLDWVSLKSNITAFLWVYNMYYIDQWFAHYSIFPSLLFSSSSFLFGTHLWLLSFFNREYMLKAVQETLYSKRLSNKHCFKCPQNKLHSSQSTQINGIALKHSAPLTLSTANQSCLNSWKCREQPVLVHFKHNCLSSMSSLWFPDSLSRDSWKISHFLEEQHCPLRNVFQIPTHSGAILYL